MRGARAGRAPPARPAAPPLPGEAQPIPAGLLPPQCRQGLAGGQARPRHRSLRGGLPERRVEGELLRHSRAGADLVFTRDVRLAQGQPRRARRARRAAARARRRDHDQGDVHAARGGLRQHRLAALAAERARRGGDDPRRRGLAGRLVLGLGRMDQRLAAGLAAARRGERLSVLGLRPVLHQLPFLGGQQPDLRDAQQHRGRARRSDRPTGAEVLPARLVVDKPARPRGAIGHRERDLPRAAVRFPLHRHLRDRGRAAAAAIDRQHAIGDLRQRLGQVGQPDIRQPLCDLRPVRRLPQRRRHRAAVRHDGARHQ